MNETIGRKGGTNDYRRALRIREIQKQKLQQYQEEREIFELEQKIRKQKRYILIRSLPIIVAGGVIRSFYTVASSKREQADENDTFVVLPDEELEEPEEIILHENDKKKEVVVEVTAQPKTVKLVPPRKEKKEEPEEEKVAKKEETTSQENKSEVIEEGKKTKKKRKRKNKVKKEKQEEKQEVNPEEKKEEGKELIPSENTPVLSVPSLESPFIVPPVPPVRSTVEVLEPFENERILSEYEKHFKDIRYELRQLLFEYSIIEKEEGKLTTSIQADVLLERLNVVIRKIEELKEQLSKMNAAKMDDTEIYQFINSCLVDFQDENSEVKDSPLYVSIAEKIEEIEQKKDRLKKRVENKKKRLEEQEKNFEQIKKNYENFEEFNQIVSEFQRTQNDLLKEIQDKVDHAVSIEKQVEVKVKYMNDQASKLLRILALSMVIPGSRSAKSFSLATLAYLSFMNQLLHPEFERKEYEVVEISDYTNDIEDSIQSIESVEGSLKEVNDQLEDTIKKFEEDYKEYFEMFPECDQLLFNLNKMKSNLEEKEYEMGRLKEENTIELEKNKAKILERTEQPL